jgi:uncharacterized protein (TIGR02466 family)
MIYHIFPTVVMIDNLNRTFTKKELDATKKHSSKIKYSVGNSVSLNQYILDTPEFKNLKAELTKKVQEYLVQIYNPKYPIEIYITQSWFNWTSKDQYHAMHEHPNSFLSGVLYIDADKSKDTIMFYKPNYQQIAIEPTQYNEHNSGSRWFNVSTGDIILFPSHLSHAVEPIKEERTRISLAFNTFIKGKLGVYDLSSELILE